MTNSLLKKLRLKRSLASLLLACSAGITPLAETLVHSEVAQANTINDIVEGQQSRQYEFSFGNVPQNLELRVPKRYSAKVTVQTLSSGGGQSNSYTFAGGQTHTIPNSVSGQVKVTLDFIPTDPSRALNAGEFRLGVRPSGSAVASGGLNESGSSTVGQGTSSPVKTAGVTPPPLFKKAPQSTPRTEPQNSKLAPIEPEVRPAPNPEPVYSSNDPRPDISKWPSKYKERFRRETRYEGNVPVTRIEGLYQDGYVAMLLPGEITIEENWPDHYYGSLLFMSHSGLSRDDCYFPINYTAELRDKLDRDLDIPACKSNTPRSGFLHLIVWDLREGLTPCASVPFCVRKSRSARERERFIPRSPKITAKKVRPDTPFTIRNAHIWPWGWNYEAPSTFKGPASSPSLPGSSPW